MQDQLTIPDYTVDPEIAARVKEFLKSVYNTTGKLYRKPQEPTAFEARAALVNLQASVRTDVSGVVASSETITQDGVTVGLHIVKPIGAAGILPVFLFFHGGGWVTGDFPTHQRFVRDLVVYSGAVAVFVDYTPSPEAKYPVAINQAYAATKWVAEHAAEIGVDAKRLAIVGNSAGGNMAAVVALMAKEKKGPAIKLQILLWPVTNADFTTESYLRYADHRFSTRDAMRWYWDNYTKDP